MRDEKTRLSCFISKVLRHEPSIIGLTVEYDGGWAKVDELIEKLCASGRKIDRDILDGNLGEELRRIAEDRRE